MPPAAARNNRGAWLAAGGELGAVTALMLSEGLLQAPLCTHNFGWMLASPCFSILGAPFQGCVLPTHWAPHPKRAHGALSVPRHHFGSFWGTRTSLQSVFWFLIRGPCCVQRNDSSTAIPPFLVFYSFFYFFSLSLYFFPEANMFSLTCLQQKALQ